LKLKREIGEGEGRDREERKVRRDLKGGD
jgi:hypothetical protein